MRVIVTRPAAQAASWVQSLSRGGIDAVALPLIDIAPPLDTAAVAQAWTELAAHRLVVFVSPNAAQRFFALRPTALSWPVGVTAASIGPGTTEALRVHGVPESAIVQPAGDAAQFDSESLWTQLSRHDWQAAQVLVVRGDGGRDWLADVLREQGARVSFVAAYRRIAPAFDGDALRRLDDAVARPGAHLWFFSSSEAVTNLVALRPDASWAGAHALATHPRIAHSARDCGFGVVSECRPTLEAVVACIQSVAS